MLDRQTPSSHRPEARLQTAIEHLTPAPLAKAFRAELVLQSSNDEPAPRLLSRLQTNAVGSKPARGRKGAA